MRKAGVLMPVSALPSRIGAGELGESAFQFIELLRENHVKIWQILPLNPVGYGNQEKGSFRNSSMALLI